MVGINTADDAGVYRLSNDLALVYTIDILTPVVDDPYLFGMIAATNCLSDIYAMGGDPKIALNIIGFPAKGEAKILGEILKGGQEKAKAAGVSIIGGHTFNSGDICYGLSVIGYIRPEKIISNAGAKPGDVIILTKPIGIGTVIQSVLLNEDKGIDLKSAVENMKTLNKDASLVMREVEAHAATDITGYGLVGHLVEMAEASKVGVEIFISKIPIHQGAIDIVKKGIFEPGIAMNYDAFSKRVINKGVDVYLSQIVFGAETSGGLAVVLPEAKADLFMEKFKQPAHIIGRITAENVGKLSIFS